MKRNTLSAMIKSFRCKDTKALFEGGSPKRFRAIQTVAARKLTLLNNAATLEFLKRPPGNQLEAIIESSAMQSFRSPPGKRLEALKGDKTGQNGIPVNEQYPRA